MIPSSLKLFKPESCPHLTVCTAFENYLDVYHIVQNNHKLSFISIIVIIQNILSFPVFHFMRRNEVQNFEKMFQLQQFIRLGAHIEVQNAFLISCYQQRKQKKRNNTHIVVKVILLSFMLIFRYSARNSDFFLL